MELFKKVLAKVGKYAFAAYLGFETHKEITNNHGVVHKEQFIAVKQPQEAENNLEISNLKLLTCIIVAVMLITAIIAFSVKVFDGLKNRAEKRVMRALGIGSIR